MREEEREKRALASVAKHVGGKEFVRMCDYIYIYKKCIYTHTQYIYTEREELIAQ